MSFTSPLASPATVRVYKAGTTYVAKTYDGKVLAASTADAAIPINAAINNFPGALARGYAGRIFIYAGTYDCKSTISADSDVTAYHAIELEGEGIATSLNFTPTSALTNGLFLKMARPRLANMRIYGNSNVTNLVQIKGEATAAFRNDYGIFENLQIDGNPATGVSFSSSSGIFTTGQKGLYFEGSRATYFYKLNNIDCRGLDIGVHFFNQKSTSSLTSGVTAINCDTGMKISGGQHDIQNCWFQGEDSVGRFGIWILPEGTGVGAFTSVSNVQTELRKTGTECAGILVDTGVSNIWLSHIRNSSASDNEWWHVVLDKTEQNPSVVYLDRMFRFPISTRQEYGIWYAGTQGIGNEFGTLAGNIVETPSPQTTIVSLADGPAKRYSANNSLITAHYNHHNGTAFTNTSPWGSGQFPVMFFKFLPSHIVNVRLLMGFWDQFAAPTTSADPLASRRGIGLWVDTNVSANFKIMHNNGEHRPQLLSWEPAYR